MSEMNPVKYVDSLTVAALGFVGLIVFGLLRDAGVAQSSAQEALSVAAPGATEVAPMAAPPLLDFAFGAAEGEAAPEAAVSDPNDADAIAAPYDQYVVTQGPHGASYGHMAVDLMAGKGATIKSPINGAVTQLYIDEWGNPTLTIENTHYRIELLHGLYTVQIGDQVRLGQPVGSESNQGNTFGWDGPCHGKEGCGYHSHINVFDKLLGQNVNPLQLFSPPAN